MEASGVGGWSSQLRYGDPAEAADAPPNSRSSAFLRYGFPTIWRR
ncbi:MAG: hypothetical protein ABWY39_06835 [Mycobacterium sp.]